MRFFKQVYPAVVSVFVLTALAIYVSFADLLKKLISIEFEVLVAVLAIQLLQVAVVAARWRLVLGGIAAQIPFSSVIRYQFMALSAGLFMPASIGTGAVQVVLAKDHVPLSKAVNSAIIDRYIAGISLVLVSLCMIPFATFMLAYISEKNAYIIMSLPLLAVALPVAILVAIGRTRFRNVAQIRKFLDDLSTIGLRGKRVANLFLTSFCGILLYITGIFILARNQGIDITFINLVILMPPVMLAASMPISYGGWGVREIGLVAALSLVSVPAVDAIAVSVQMGFVGLVPGLLGGVMWTRRSIANAKSLATSIDAGSLRRVPGKLTADSGK